MLPESHELHGSGVQQTRGEDVLDPEAAVSNPLLMVVAQDGVERGPVRLDAIDKAFCARWVTCSSAAPKRIAMLPVRPLGRFERLNF